MFKTRFISMLVLLMTAVTGAWAEAETYSVKFEANGNSKTIENVTLPKTWACNWNSENGELDLIIKELYQLSEGYSSTSPNTSVTGGNGKVTVVSSKDQSITISEPFEGTATVEGMYKNNNIGEYFSYSLTISIPGYVAPATVAVTGVTLAPTSATLTLGETETVTLIPTVLPGDATDKSVTWSSSDEAVATVADGVVTAVAAGEATITVTTTDGAKTATCAVTVAAPAASTYTVTLKEGTDDADKWTITPAEATTTGVAAGTEVKATYGGVKKVKSVKAKKKTQTSPFAGVTTSDRGKVIGADGKIYANAAAANAASTTALAVIAYVGSETGDDTYKNGLAIALADEGSMNWSTAKSTCEGKTAITGAKWCLPSLDQWKQMFAANGGNDAEYNGLNTTINNAGGTTLQASAEYWSSSEDVPGVRAYYFYLNDGDADRYEGGEGGSKRVRACLAF